MKAWHGSGKKFDQFDPKFIGTGEGVAARGKGFNFACHKAVAMHYLNNSAGDTGYLYEVVVPDLDEMLNLDASASSATGLDLADLAKSAYREYWDFDPDDYYEAAANHDDASLYYSDDRAEEMFERLLLNCNDRTALEELNEWSPGFDWDGFVDIISPGSFELDVHDDSGEQLFTALVRACRDYEEGAQDILVKNGVRGTYGNEPIGASERAKDTVSVVVFKAEDITVKSCVEHTVRPEAEFRVDGDDQDFAL